MTTAAGIGGLVGGLSGLFGANASNIQPPPSPISFTNQVGAGNQAFGGMSNFQNVYGNLGQSTLPYAQQIFSNLYNNPYASTMQQGAGTAANMGMSAATGAYNAGTNLTGAGIGMLPYAQSIMNTAMDPQQALYNATVSQVGQQSNANNAAAGVSTTPYGASVTSNALGNFNLAWQNNQLQREATGAGAAGGLLNTAGGAINTGAGIANAAPGQFLSSASMPYATAMGIGQGQQAALNNLQGAYSGAAGIDNTSIQNWLAYLGAGNAATQTQNSQFQTLLNQNQLANNQNMMFGNAIGGGLRMLGGANSTNSPLFGSTSSFLPGSSFMTNGPVGSFG